MKTLLKLTIAIILAMATTLTPISAIAGIKLEVKKQSFEYFNEGDRPPMVPVMILTFEDLPSDKAALAEDWKKKITEKLLKSGPIKADQDYMRIYQILEEFHPQFRENGLTTLTVSFPRTQTVGFIYIGPIRKVK